MTIGDLYSLNIIHQAEDLIKAASLEKVMGLLEEILKEKRVIDEFTPEEDLYTCKECGYMRLN